MKYRLICMLLLANLFIAEGVAVSESDLYIDRCVMIDGGIVELPKLCGVNSVYVALRDIGEKKDYIDLLRQVRGAEGFLSMYDLIEIVRGNGAASIAVDNLRLSDLEHIPFPIIVWVKSKKTNKMDHFFTIRKASNSRFFIIDMPDVIVMDEEELEAIWSGKALIVAQNDAQLDTWKKKFLARQSSFYSYLSISTAFAISIIAGYWLASDKNNASV